MGDNEQTVPGAPAGVTFDLTPHNTDTTTAPQPQAQQPQDQEQKPPVGVTFGNGKTIDLTGKPPAGVTFSGKSIDLTTKEPTYKDAAAGATSLSARPNDFHTWLQDLQADVRNGTDTTWFGAMMKRLGAKGTAYGVDPGTQAVAEMTNPFAALPEGLGKLGEGAIEFLRTSGPVMKHMAAGDSFQTAITKAASEDPYLLKKAEIGGNKMVGGAFQAAGPVAAVVAPEATLAAAPTITGGMVSQQVATRVAKAMGADDDTAELVGNVAALGAAHQLNEKINPLSKRFGVAVNDRTAAEAEYVNRSRNLETARGQAAEAQKRAIDTAAKEGLGQAKPEDTIQARQLANDAAKNLTDAQKAFDQASANRADATIKLEKLHRQIMSEASKENQDFMDRATSDSEKAKDLFEKAIPSKGAHQYSDEDYDVTRAHIEKMKQAGTKINSIEEFYNAAEGARQGIEDRLDPAFERLKDSPLKNNPKAEALEKLQELNKLKDGTLDSGLNELSKYNLTDMSVGEARDILKQLNNEQRSAMKGASNWDIAENIATDPKFAARFFASQAIRDGLFGTLEDSGVKGAREARAEEASIINVRNAAGAQLRANRGGTTVRGSGSTGPIRGLVARLMRRSIVGGSTAVGAELGGVPGAVAGGAVGEVLAEPVHDALVPRDMTRDEHIGKSMQLRGTLRQPVQITDTGAPAPQFDYQIPPDVKAAGPEPLKLTPRENTDLHAELASHFGQSIGDSTYEELENNLRQDVKTKVNNGQPLDSSEKALLTKINKADVADLKIREQAALDAQSATKTLTEPETKEEKQKTKEVLKDALAIAGGTATAADALKVNPTLAALGRPEETALISHPPDPKMASTAPVKPIPDLPEGMSQEMAHIHEWAHAAVGAVDGLEPIEIRSDLHPKMATTGSAGIAGSAATVFDATPIYDEKGDIDPEALQQQLTQWLTQKMAGPAAHEIFDGMTYEDIKQNTANRGDFRKARGLIREAYPDATPKQVEELVDAAYSRARDFLTQEHIASRVRANAAVREEGLAETLHASHGRMTKFANDIREAHADATGTDNGPDGGGAGEGGEKTETLSEREAGGKREPGAERAEAGEEKNQRGNKGGGKGGSREAAKEPANAGRGVEASELTRKLAIPTERSTGAPEIDEAIRAGGAIPGGRMKGDASIGLEDLNLFHDPNTGTTLALKTPDVTPERVATQLAKSRAEYAAAENAAKGKEETSELSKSKAGDILDKMKDTYGLSQNAGEVKNGHAFITPQGDFLHLPTGVDHGEAIIQHGGPENTRANQYDNRPEFVNKSGAVRVRHYNNRAGDNLAFSVPKEGVTSEQVDAINRATAQGLSRNGTLNMERADVKADTVHDLSKQKAFPRAGDAEQMLRDIKAHPEDTSEISKSGGVDKAIEDAAKTNGEGFTFHPETGKTPKTGYMVETELQRGKDFGHPPTADEIRQYIADNKDAIDANPNLHIGGYRNTLGLSTRIADRAEAEKLGRDTNQTSIYDLKNGKEIPTGGTGRVANLAADQEKGIISTRQPSGVKATENPLTENLTIGRDSIEKVEGMPEKVAAKIKKYTGIRIPAGLKDPGQIMDLFTDHVKNNLKDLYNRVPKPVAEQTAKWYDSANKLANRFAETYGASEKQMAGVIAAMSPQKDWDQNVSLAERVADVYKNKADIKMTPEMEKRGKEISTARDRKGKLTNAAIAEVFDNMKGKSLNDLTDPVERAAWVRIYDEAHNPRSYNSIDPGTGESRGTVKTDKGEERKVAWGSLNEIGKALSILQDGSRENISNQLGEAHKVRNFYNNILDPNNPAGHVTIDTHAVAAALQRPLSGKSVEVADNFGGIGSKQTGAKGLYGLYADAYRQAAAELGLQPRQLQSVVWEKVREQFPDEFKRNEDHTDAIKKIWNQYKNGKISLDKARENVLQYSSKAVADMQANKPGAK